MKTFLAEASLDKAEVYFFERLQSLVDAKKVNLPVAIERICGVDARYGDGRVKAVATLFVRSSMKESNVYHGHFSLPYLSGLLYLHEGPFVVAAVKGLKTPPELVCFDAQGIAHPRLGGLAKMCGVVLGIPSIGIAKSLLIGTVKDYKQKLQSIVLKGREVGFVTRQDGVERFWSPGYSVSIRKLESLIVKYGEICEKSIRRAHEIARSSKVI